MFFINYPNTAAEKDGGSGPPSNEDFIFISSGMHVNATGDALFQAIHRIT